MNDRVLTIHQTVEINENLVEELETLIEKAKSGEMTSFAYGAELTEKRYITGVINNPRRSLLTLIGIIAVLQKGMVDTYDN